MGLAVKKMIKDKSLGVYQVFLPKDINQRLKVKVLELNIDYDKKDMGVENVKTCLFKAVVLGILNTKIETMEELKELCQSISKGFDLEEEE